MVYVGYLCAEEIQRDSGNIYLNISRIVFFSCCAGHSKWPTTHLECFFWSFEEMNILIIKSRKWTQGDWLVTWHWKSSFLNAHLFLESQDAWTFCFCVLSISKLINGNPIHVFFCVCVSVFTHPLLYSNLVMDPDKWLTLLSEKPGSSLHYTLL